MMKRTLSLLTILLAAFTMVVANSNIVKTLAPKEVKVHELHAAMNSSKLMVSMEMVLDSLTLKGNHQILITPYVETGDAAQSVALPTVCVSGRNMHYVYERTGKTINSGNVAYDIRQELRRLNNTAQTVVYNESTPIQPWMLQGDVVVRVVVDPCGCGRPLGPGEPLASLPLYTNPIEHLILKAYPAPVVDKPVIINHHGVARVEFEVDKFDLHEDVYSYTHRVTKRNHTIDNRAELKLIDDSIRYALSDPNVEIQSISVCGYASPESPYLHNEYLATNRSRAVAEYIARHHNLPTDKCSYDAVPENWAGFRQQALAATDITENERTLLLQLIDRPAYGPTDYDAKEKELNSDAKYATLYKEKIHPDWFPKLRYTDFVIRTQLKPLTVEQLLGVIKTSPELMSLNQIYSVANYYPHGSEGFRHAIQTAIQYYPDSISANANAAALAIEDKDYDKAEAYLAKAGNSDDVINMRGVLEVNRRNYAKAYEVFSQIADRLPEARRNMELIKHLKDVKI